MMMTRSVLVLVLLSLAGTAQAQSDAAKAFGARELIQQVSLSPDAKHLVAIVATPGRGSRAVVITVDGSALLKPILAANGTDERLDHCEWASDTQLICGISIIKGKMINGQPARKIGFDRLVTLSVDGTGFTLLSAGAEGQLQNGGRVIDWQGDATGAAVLMTRQFNPQQEGEGLGVERVDPLTLHRRIVEPAKLTAENYITDGRGAVRIMGVREKVANVYDDTDSHYFYRKASDKKWLLLGKVTGNLQNRSGFEPDAVDPTLDAVYGFDKLGGRKALFKVALDGSLKREVVYARPDVDLDSLVRIGRQRRVVGVGFVTDRRRTEFFDPDLKTLSIDLSKALPGAPLVEIVDSSADENKLLLWAGSDVDPGRYLIFDKKTRHLHSLIDVRPALENVPLAPVKSISFPAADGTTITAYLTMPVAGPSAMLPAIVMPHGGTGARDKWGFDWLAQFFAARGYVVLQPNFPGPTGNGTTWFQQNGFKSWKIAISDINDGGRWLVKEGIAAPDQLAIVGWSYGGYAALQSAVLDPDLFKAIVAVAPVTDLETLRRDSDDFTDSYSVDVFVGTGPHIREGSPAQNAGRFKAPVLLFHGDEDQTVGIGESRLMASRLRSAGKSVELVEFDGLDHQLDDNTVRTAMLDKADVFLRTSMRIK